MEAKSSITINDWKLLLLATIQEEWGRVEIWGNQSPSFPNIEGVRDKLDQMEKELIQLESEFLNGETQA